MLKDQATVLREIRNSVSAQKRDNTQLAQRRKKNSVSLVVTSGKGGVGKTQLSVNLSIALSRHRKKVLLFDADMGLANVDIVLGVHPKRHLIHLLEGVCKINDIVFPGPEGIEIIPAGSGVEQLANLDTAQLEYITHELQSMEHHSDFLIIDTSAGISRSVMQFAVSGDRVIVVSTPEPAAFADAYATIKSVFRHNPSARIELIVNYCRKQGEGREIFNRMRLIVMQFLNKSIEYLGELPYEKHFSAVARRQGAIIILAPSCAYSKSLSAIARKIAGLPLRGKHEEKTYFSRLLWFLSRQDKHG